MLRSDETRPSLGALLLALLAAGCGSATIAAPPPAARTPSNIEPPSDEPARSAWETCYSSFTPTGDAQGDLARLVRDCGTTGGMRAVTKVTVATQGEDDPVDRYAFEVPSPDKCYRVYAAGDSSIKDLDLLLRGPSGTSVLADLTHDAWPVLPPRQPACLSEPGLYMLEVSVYRGSGRYALQIWGR